MIKTTVEFSGIDAMIAELDQRVENFHRGVHADLDWFGRTTTQEMIETHTFQNRTFRLETSIGYRALFWTPTAMGWRVEVEATAPYASEVEHGHPGPPPARPYPFFWPVWYRYYPDTLEARLQQTVDRTLGGG